MYCREIVVNQVVYYLIYDNARIPYDLVIFIYVYVITKFKEFLFPYVTNTLKRMSLTDLIETLS